MVKVVFEYFAKKYEAVAGKENKIYKAVACCIRSYIWCLDKYVKFVNKNAYIQVALRNKNFCSAMKETFYLMIRHIGRFSVIAVISWVMVLIGKLFIVGSCAYVTMLLIESQFPSIQ